MKKKFPYDPAVGKPSRRDFLRLSGASLATALMARYGFSPALAQMADAIPAELQPGSPNNPRGWTNSLPPIPEGLPVDPPVTITGSRRAPWEFADGDDIENSPFTRLNAAVTGIHWQLAFNWVEQDEGLQKYNLAIASNELPDFMETVPLQVYSELLENDLLEDITDVYEEVAHPIWLKEAMNFSDGVAWRLAEVNGRKMGLPYIEQAAQNDKLLWLRQDWLEAVGLDAPTTVEENCTRSPPLSKRRIWVKAAQARPSASPPAIRSTPGIVRWTQSLALGASSPASGHPTPMATSNTTASAPK